MDIPIVKVIIYNQCGKCDRTYIMKTNQLCKHCDVFCTKYNEFCIKYDPFPLRYSSCSQLITLCKGDHKK
jgi:hypothetical protein